MSHVWTDQDRVCARCGIAMLEIAVGHGEDCFERRQRQLLASDPTALGDHHEDVTTLRDSDVAYRMIFGARRIPLTKER